MAGTPAPAGTANKTTLTPKAIIFQKFGSAACYEVEEVQVSNQNECPGLAIPQKGPPFFRCRLQLPEISVTSKPFKRKRDAEQSAAEMALEKLGINREVQNPIQDPLDELVARLSYLFSNEFLTSTHPSSGHFRATLQREGALKGLVPVPAIAVCDAKLCSLCKSINPEVESNPILVASLILKAAARLSASIATSEGQLYMARKNPYPAEIIQSLTPHKSDPPGSISVQAIYIPCSVEKPVAQLTLNFSSTGYYIDVIAQKLGSGDASKVLVSRTVGKASSETRLYFSVPRSYLLDLSSGSSNAKDCFHYQETFNPRASYFCGHDVSGDSIMASVGYTWKSTDLYYEDLPLHSYYRMLLNKVPSGIYKLSREALLTAELPMAFTTRTNWRGAYPRDILCTFCRQHRLPEPIFSTESTHLESSSSKFSESCKRLDSKESSAEADTATVRLPTSLSSNFRCEVKVVSKCQNSIMEYCPKETYKKQDNALQNSSLKLLSWLKAYFDEQDMPLEHLTSSAEAHGIHYSPETFIKVFESFWTLPDVQHRTVAACAMPHDSNGMAQSYDVDVHRVKSLIIKGSASGVSPSNGSLVCINYNVSLLPHVEQEKVLLEAVSEFEFEIGAGAVVPHLEAVVAQLSVDQSASYLSDLPSMYFVLAATEDCSKVLSLLSSNVCSLEYSLTLLKVTEPMEDRMEQALFSPPLSKQRVEFAVKLIKESSASSLIDFGCGSGSLLDSLLDYPTTLDKIVGIDISQKSLARAAKMLHSKLSGTPDAVAPGRSLKSAILYEGSITQFDAQLRGFDIGTCLEVIEHMEEDQAFLFGDVALSYFCPKILIVSTPNYEYNPILQKSNLPNLEDDADDKSSSQACRFRNHDHKFEWTRKQFNSWASEVAERHNYSVDFDGVGGLAGVEPGFASQIAVFRRRPQSEKDVCAENVDSANYSKVVWEWNGMEPTPLLFSEESNLF